MKPSRLRGEPAVADLESVVREIPRFAQLCGKYYPDDILRADETGANHGMAPDSKIYSKTPWS